MPAILGVAGMSAFAETVHVEPNQTELMPLPDSTGSWFEENPNTSIEIDRVEVEENATLILPPFESVVINHLIAHEGAKIQIAHSATSAHGAKARFFVRHITGHVLLEARGANGREGRDGRHGRQGRDGERGRNARTLLFGLFYLGDGEDGRMGYAGEDGEDGEDGENGGNGGEIYFYYQSKPSDSKILIDTSGGAAGQGGKPGLGGFGGNGGLGGKGIKSGKQGAMGPRGRSGRAGRPAQPGLPGRAAMYQLPASLFSCLLNLDVLSQSGDLTEEDLALCRDQNSQPIRRDSRQIQPMIIQSGDLIRMSEQEGVSMISADGQDGRDAWVPASSGSNAENGTSASHGGNITIFIQQMPDALVVTSRGGKGGHGADGTRGQRGRNGEDGRDGSLFRKAKAGTNGTDGQEGGNGSNGGSGGHGGRVQIIYVPSSPEAYDPDWVNRIHLDISGGEAGVAGRGASGGAAGLGGRGGKKFLSRDRESDGQNGRAGRDGRDGIDGVRGNEGSYLLLEANSMTDWIIEEFRNSLTDL